MLNPLLARDRAARYPRTLSTPITGAPPPQTSLGELTKLIVEYVLRTQKSKSVAPEWLNEFAASDANMVAAKLRELMDLMKETEGDFGESVLTGIGVTAKPESAYTDVDRLGMALSAQLRNPREARRLEIARRLSQRHGITLAAALAAVPT